MRNRTGMVIALTVCLILGMFAPAVAQTLPLPQVGQQAKGGAFVTPSVMRALQGQEKKNQAANVRVIVSFETRGGRSGNLSFEDVSAARASALAALPAHSVGFAQNQPDLARCSASEPAGGRHQCRPGCDHLHD